MREDPSDEPRAKILWGEPDDTAHSLRSAAVGSLRQRRCPFHPCLGLRVLERRRVLHPLRLQMVEHNVDELHAEIGLGETPEESGHSVEVS